VQRKISCLLLLIFFTALPLKGGEKRRIHLLQDDGQTFIVSKVYELKHIAANEITPYILTAVERFDDRSKVDRMRYTAGKKEFLVVSTPVDMMYYVDEMVAAMDHPSSIVDQSGSIVNGTGMSRKTYLPRHRSSDQMVNIANQTLSFNGMVFRDSASNLIYWKDTGFVSDLIDMWMRLFDRPVPQVELVFRIYQVRKSTLQDLGTDYLSWKNGPGMGLFSTGLQSTNYASYESGLSGINQFSSWSFGGMSFSPQFDASFIRLLSQQGAAKMTTTASLRIISNPEGEYMTSFTPANQNITKDTDGRMSVITGNNENNYITVKAPVICFQRTGVVNTVYKGEESDFTIYGPTGGNIRFDYNLIISRITERNNLGVELTEGSAFQSTVTLDLGIEQLLARCDKSQRVSQTTGIPFLSSLPILKYLFGTTENIEEHNELFITVEARSVRPEDQLAAWNGKLLHAEEYLKEARKE